MELPRKNICSYPKESGTFSDESQMDIKYESITTHEDVDEGITNDESNSFSVQHIISDQLIDLNKTIVEIRVNNIIKIGKQTVEKIIIIVENDDEEEISLIDYLTKETENEEEVEANDINSPSKRDPKYLRRQKVHVHNIRSTKIKRCTGCDYETTWRGNFARHLKLHEDPLMHPLLTCEICGYKITNSCLFKKHQELHFQQDNGNGKGKNSLAQEIKQQPKIKHRKTITVNHKDFYSSAILRGFLYKCHVCEYKTIRRGDLKKHLCIHNVDLPGAMRCSQCDYQTTNKSIFDKHCKLHEDPEKYPEYECAECGYTIINKMLFIKHVKLHRYLKMKAERNNDNIKQEDSSPKIKKESEDDTVFEEGSYENKVYTCLKCYYKTPHKRHFLKHNLRSCKKSEPSQWYSCTQCDYQTGTKVNFTRHGQSHKNRRDPAYECRECGFKTISRHLLRSHQHLVRQSDDQTNECFNSDDQTQSDVVRDDLQEEEEYECDDLETQEDDTEPEELQITKYPAQKDLPPIVVYSCDKCGYETRSERYFRQHIIQKHPLLTKVHKCSQCAYYSPVEKNLKKHLITHRNFIKFKCTECSYKTSDKTNFLKHIRLHRTRKGPTYKCDYCNYQTISRNLFKSHQVLRKHRPAQKQVLICEQCEYQTLSLGHFKAHRLCHMNRENLVMYKCPECSYESFRKNDLAIHFRRHNAEEVPKYLCDKCDYVTINRGNLTRHLYRQHGCGNVQTLLCDKCDYVTIDKSRLTAHFYRQHGRSEVQKYLCDKCDYLTINKSNFTKHLSRQHGCRVEGKKGRKLCTKYKPVS